MITLSCYHDNMLSYFFFLKTSHTDLQRTTFYSIVLIKIVKNWTSYALKKTTTEQKEAKDSFRKQNNSFRKFLRISKGVVQRNFFLHKCTINIIKVNLWRKGDFSQTAIKYSIICLNKNFLSINYYLFDNKYRQFSILLYCGVSKITNGCFLLYFAWTAATKAETLVFWLRAVQKKLCAVLHNVESQLHAM
jgi:hypothetical protein